MKSAVKDLYRAILTLRTPEDCERFFTDLCTPAEIEAMTGRWSVAKLVDQQVPYREIYQRTGVSTATVTRVARSLMHGESGYRRILDRLKEGVKMDRLKEGAKMDRLKEGAKMDRLKEKA